MRYFTADLHFGDKRIKRICKRPKDIENLIIYNINKTLHRGDTLYIIGDLFSSDDKPVDFGNGTVWKKEDYDVSERVGFVKKIRSDLHKVMITGNHDDESFLKYFKSALRLDMIVPFMPLRIGNHDVMLAHNPTFALLEPSKPLLCGHVHKLFRVCRNALNIGIDRWDYFPVGEETVLGKLDAMVESMYTYSEL